MLSGESFSLASVDADDAVAAHRAGAVIPEDLRERRAGLLPDRQVARARIPAAALPAAQEIA